MVRFIRIIVRIESHSEQHFKELAEHHKTSCAHSFFKFFFFMINLDLYLLCFFIKALNWFSGSGGDLSYFGFCLLNINSSHFSPDKFESLSEICSLTGACNAFVLVLSKVLHKLHENSDMHTKRFIKFVLEQIDHCWIHSCVLDQIVIEQG